MTALSPVTNNRDALEARFALRVTSALDQLAVPHDIEQRLRVARDLALSRARQAKATATTQVKARDVAMVGWGQAALNGSSDEKTPWWVGTAMAALALALVVGLFAIDYRNVQVQIEATAEVDALLLADDLPPKAYSDVGFREYLRASPQD